MTFKLCACFTLIKNLPKCKGGERREGHRVPRLKRQEKASRKASPCSPCSLIKEVTGGQRALQRTSNTLEILRGHRAVHLRRPSPRLPQPEQVRWQLGSDGRHLSPPGFLPAGLGAGARNGVSVAYMELPRADLGGEKAVGGGVRTPASFGHPRWAAWSPVQSSGRAVSRGSTVAQCVKLLPTTQASHMNTSLSPGCSTSDSTPC